MSRRVEEGSGLSRVPVVIPVVVEAPGSDTPSSVSQCLFLMGALAGLSSLEFR